MADLKNILATFSACYRNLNLWTIESSKSELIVDDTTHGTIFVPLGSADGFEVNNPSARPFCLIQIDNRLLPQQKGGQCDGTFVYDESIHLLEFKTNTTTFDKKHGRKHYNKAIRQLRNTIKRFKLAGIRLFALAPEVEAHICLNNTFPRSRTSEMNRALKFTNDKKTKGVVLLFDNKKTI